jgi:hypothetical protein
MVDRLTRAELELIARSYAATRQLSTGDVRRVLAEAVALADELDRMRGLVARLPASWATVRTSMTAIYRVSASSDPTMHDRMRALSDQWRELRRVIDELVVG